MQYSSYLDLLNDEFKVRQQTNRSYSLRAFARDLDMSAPRLSQIMNRKQGLSVESAEKVAQKLKLTSEKKKWFCHSVGELHSRSEKERKEFKKKITSYKEEAKAYSEIGLEYFKVISDWYHFAILELTYLQDFRNDPKWIAKMIGVSVDEVNDAIERLKKLNLLEEKDGKLSYTVASLVTPSDIPSDALKKFNSTMIEKANRAMYEQDVQIREYSSNFVAVNKEIIPQIKQKIRDFRRELMFEGYQTTNKDSLYCLNIQLFSLSEMKE